MKVLLDYENGVLTGPGGFSYTWGGLEPAEFKEGEGKPDPDAIAKLIATGCTADDIIKMKASGVL
jgi:hypothetical protein